MDWVHDFYQQQGLLTGLYVGGPDDYYRGQAARVGRLAPGAATVLELGAGGGQAAAALADSGVTVTAIELVARAAQNAQMLAAGRPGLTVVHGDMYWVDLAGAQFDAVVYWDGFGIGTDADQASLLSRAGQWLAADGRILVDAYTPWYWAAAAGQEQRYGHACSVYSFDASGCRMLNRWWDSQVGEHSAVEQSLRCYSPADLALMAAPVGLVVTGVEAHGAMDYSTSTYSPAVPLGQAMSYTAVLQRAG